MTVAIEPVSIAKFRMIDKVELHSIVLSTVYDLAKQEVVLHRNGKIRDRQVRFFEMRSPIARQEHCDFMAQSRQSFRKSADNIGKTSGFRVRHALRCGESDSQPKLLQLGFATYPPAREFPHRPVKLHVVPSSEKNREAKARRRV